MLIKKLYGIEGARNATGIVVVADIFRAATMEACALYNGAKYIIPVSTKEEALRYKSNNPEYLTAGEEGGFKIDELDFGNSPSEMLCADLEGKILVHRSSEGTQGLVNAINADELIFGSFVTLSAIKKYIKRKNPNNISIVAMNGIEGEDGMFTDFLEQDLKEMNPDIKKVKNYLSSFKGLAWYFDEKMKEFPKEDFDICLDLDRFDFFCKVCKINNHLKTVKQSF